MNNILDNLQTLKERFELLKHAVGLNSLIKLEESLKNKTSLPDFWLDQKKAVEINRELEFTSKKIRDFNDLEVELNDLIALAVLLEKDEKGGSNDLGVEVEQKYQKLETDFTHLEVKSLLSGKHDNSDAILSIHAGVGGVDAQDFTQMLERMYARFCEREGYSWRILDKSYGNEAGIKSVVLEIKGELAYGYLKSENGVHRLLRNSPFNADNLRQTSFALVEVIPEQDDDVSVEIKDEDLKIDVFRSSGPGGQSVNTTDSAVRITHLLTGLVVSCQSERSQHQNRENALKILKAKLIKKKIEEHEEKLDKLKGEVRQAEWGRQIRSYFLYGNKLVKDHRTNYEETNVEAVLDGAVRPFMETYLRHVRK
jgi:peptide chain release factor 2